MQGLKDRFEGKGSLLRCLTFVATILVPFVCAFGQSAVRVDIPLQTGGPNVPTSGGPLPQALWLANAAVTLCTHPSSTLSACQGSPITTFTDATSATPCPSNAQLVQLPGTTCTAKAGSLGNAGFWYVGGIIDYFVTSAYGTYGPFTISTAQGTAANPGGASGSIQFNAGVFGGAGTMDSLGNLGASVNSQQNVMMFGAKGDCSTDDHDAIEKASVAARKLSVGAALPAVVYFPKPPGGCYLSSTLQYIGVPFVGQPSGDGVSTVQYGVTLKGQPGYDVLHVPDPMNGAGNLTFTNSSAVISATNGYVAGDMVVLSVSGGTLPTNFATNTVYFVLPTGLNNAQFELSATIGGAAIVAGSAGSGTPTAQYPWNQSWLIQDISFAVNNSVLPTTTTVPGMLHRWPGRWVDDGGTTASSTTFTSPHGNIGCADIGQQILVGGAGATSVTSTLGGAITSTSQTVITLGAATTSSWPTIFGYVQVDSEIMMYVGTQANGLTSLTVLRGQAGTTAATHSNGATLTVLGNLATTISAVSPCWGNANGGASTWKTITLGAAATTSVSHAHYYVSILDLPVATNIGNCSMAFDNIDAKTADWPNPAQQVSGGNHSKLINVNFNSTNGTPVANNHCGLYMGGGWNTLTTHVSDHVNFYAQDFGVVESQSEINSFLSSGGDFQTWNHMQFFVDRQPWISYNGGEGTWTNVQLTTLSGPQFMNLSNNSADVAGWTIDIREFESWGIPGDTRFGLRVEGTGYTIDGEVGISADSTNAAWIDSLVSTCNCFVGSAAPIHLFGAGNAITGTVESAAIDNQGKGNSAWGFNNGAGYPGGQPYPAPATLVPVKGMPGYLGGSEPDFAADGYPATPYRHEDLFLWPSDLLIGTAGTDLWTTIHQYDTAAPITGEKLLFKASGGTASFQSAYLANPIGSPAGAFTIGTNFPAAKGTLYVSLEGANGNTVGNFCLPATGATNCSTFTVSTSAFQTFAIPFNLTTATGNITLKNGSIVGGQDLWLAWAYIDIAPQLPAGTTIGGAAPLTTNPTGKTTWTLGTTAIPANTCSLQTSVTLSGVTTSSAISWQPSADYTAVTGFSPAGTTIYFYAWPTSNTIHWYACNASASPVTPGGSTTWNVGVTF